MSILREFALGFPYFKTKALIKETEFMPAEQLVLVRNKLLERTLNRAKKVPFYSKYLNHLEIKDKVLRIQLEKMPVITKDTIRRHLKDFCRTIGWRAIKATTGGSTGQPFEFYMDRFSTRQKEKAFIFDQWGRVGYQMGDSIFNLRGRTPEKGKFIYNDRLFNIHYASSFNLKSETVDQYVKAINEIKPLYLHGYPSTMYQFASLMERSEQYFKHAPRAVFCGSEKLFPYQRALIEKVFGCQIYAWYGHSECLALGGECEFSSILHFYPQYGYTELLPTGTKNSKGKEIFSIVATGFNNVIMPLIRYQTGDFAVLADSQVCDCGRNYLLVDEVLGREQEFVVDFQKELVSATSLIFGQHFEVFSGLDGLYLEQNELGFLSIVMKKNSAFKDDDFDAMKLQIKDLLGDRFKVSYDFQNKIPRSQIGKAKLVQQKLDINQFFNRSNN